MVDMVFDATLNVERASVALAAAAKAVIGSVSYYALC